MLQIVWQGPQASQILHCIGHTYQLYPTAGHICVLSTHVYNWPNVVYMQTHAMEFGIKPTWSIVLKLYVTDITCIATE